VSPGCTFSWRTSPLSGARISCSIFIDSITTALERSHDGDGALRPRGVGRAGLLHDPRRHRLRVLRSPLSVREDGERIGLVDARACTCTIVCDDRSFVWQRGNQLGALRVDEARVELEAHHLRMSEQGPQERRVRGCTVDTELAQRALEAIRRGGEVLGVSDDLREQRVEARAGPVARVGERVDPDAGARRGLEDGQRPAGGTRRPVRAHGLEVHASLDGAAAHGRGAIGRKSELGELAAAGEP
jgi:hypothetical protein